MQHVDGHLAGDLTGGRTAHTITHGEQQPALTHGVGERHVAGSELAGREVRDHEVVLVVLAHQADRGSAGEAHTHAGPFELAPARAGAARLIGRARERNWRLGRCHLGLVLSRAAHDGL